LFAHCDIIEHVVKTAEPPVVNPPSSADVQARLTALSQGKPSTPKPPPLNRVDVREDDQGLVGEGNVSEIIEANELYEKALIEFRILLARYHANTEDVRAKLAVETAASFILSLWPDSLKDLDSAKHNSGEPRFSL
jgi:hypothetical protein